MHPRGHDAVSNEVANFSELRGAHVISPRFLCSRKYVAILLCCFVVYAAFAQESTNRQFSTGPAPSWVIQIDPDLGYAGSATNTGNSYGENFILVDQQKNAQTQQFYSHIIKKITSQNGVQNGSRVEIDFDPSFQQLTVHFILIIRDGQIIDRLDPAKFKVIQQESGLDRHLFNGELSAVLFLEDIRVGDVIDYAYSISGENPIFKGHFISSFLLQWAYPMHQQRYRLLWPASKKLTVQNHGTTIQPEIKSAGQFLDYRWSLDNEAPFVFEGSVPGSVESYRWIQFTDFSDWRDVANWALPLYSSPAKMGIPDELAKKIFVWKYLTPEEQITKALRFVQDDVRYLGIEIGPNSHQPNPPDAVFARRFGDCKDKVVLLCAILHELNIEAAPVLVDSYHGAGLEKWAPSPYAFNHVVTRVKLDGHYLWLDPTMAYQRGPLKDIYFPDYTSGLVVAPGTEALTKIPTQPGQPLALILETIRFVAYGKPALYEVRTIRRGGDADAMRAALADTTRDALERGYLNHFAKRFPGIKSTLPLDIRDDEEKNEITIIRNYSITNAWELTEDKSRYTFSVYPEDIYNYARGTDTPIRTQPLAILYPYSLKQKITVILPERGNFKDSVERESDGIDRFERKVSYSNQQLDIDFTFETLTNVVLPSQLSEHLATLKAIRDKCFYSISRPNEKAPHKPSQPNWPILGLTACYSLVAAGGIFAAYRFRPVLRVPPLLNPDPALTGIGGWLILPMLGLFARFFLVAAHLNRYAGVYSSERWNLVTNPASASYNPNYAPLLIFELLWNVGSLFIIPLLLVLLFQKRFAFPRYMIAFLILHVVMLGLDTVWSGMIPVAHKVRTAEPQFVTMFSGTLLWVAYFLKSRRVKLTFVR